MNSAGARRTPACAGAAVRPTRWVERPGGVTLVLTVVPNAKHTAADGWFDGALRVRLAAPPVEGKANEHLTAWLADELGLPRRAVRLVRGATTRRKQVEIDAPSQAVAAWLVAVAPGD